MGEIIKIICKSCKACWQCHIGCGLMHGNLKNVADLFSDNEKAEIMKYAEKTEFPLFDFRYQLSYCKNCNEITSIPLLRLIDKKKNYIGVCQQCGNKIEFVNDETKVHCPNCHKKTLKIEETGQWD